MQKQTLTVKELAGELGRSPAAIRRIIDQGHLRRLRGHRGKWLVSRVELNRYLKEGVVYG